MSETIYFVMEMVGTVAFSISGTLIGIKKRMDILGIIILGTTTAVGGGILRDIILGIDPPNAFVRPEYLAVAAVTAIVVFIPAVRNYLDQSTEIFEKLLLLMDSVGLGIFTVVGVKAGYMVSGFNNIFLLLFVGVITGVGGGVLRDVFAQEPPYIFYKHFYACASVSGAIFCIVCRKLFGEGIAMFGGTAVVVLLRLLAAHFRWKLPRA